MKTSGPKYTWGANVIHSDGTLSLRDADGCESPSFSTRQVACRWVSIVRGATGDLRGTSSNLSWGFGTGLWHHVPAFALGSKEENRFGLVCCLESAALPQDFIGTSSETWFCSEAWAEEEFPASGALIFCLSCASQTFGSTCVSWGVHAMGKRPRAKSAGGAQETAMKALRTQGVSLEVIAGASQMDVAKVEAILGKEPRAEKWGLIGWNVWKQRQE